MKLRKRVIPLFAALVLVVSACSQNTASQDNEKNKETTPASQQGDVALVSNTIESILKTKAGKYSGDTYDRAMVEKELDQFPKDLNADEAFSRLVHLVGEDYQGFFREFNAFDTSYKVNMKQPGGVNAPDVKEHTLNVEILLDASGSMAGLVDGSTKMDLAKGAIKQFVSSMPEGTAVSLRVYGHKGSNSSKDKKVSCESSEVIYPHGPYEEDAFQKALGKVKPTGWTPLGLAIRSAKQDLSKHAGEGAENIVYVVSDGIETCGGDPVKEAKQLHGSDIKAVVNIIGFDVDNAGQKALKKVADAGGGSYQTVSSAGDLKSYFQDEYTRLFNEWFDWQAIGINNLSDQRGEKLQEVMDLYAVFYELKDTDYAHLLEALDYLEGKQMLNREVIRSVKEKIYERDKVVKEYYESQEQKLKGVIDQEYQKLKEAIETKGESMKEKYRR